MVSNNFLGVAMATLAKMTGAVKKFTALTATAFVAFSLTACGGGDSYDSATSVSDKGDKAYLAWFNYYFNENGNLIFEKAERLGLENSRIHNYEGGSCETPINSKLEQVIQVTAIIDRTYKIKDEYRPKREWGHITTREYFIKADFTPYLKDVEKIRLSIGFYGISNMLNRLEKGKYIEVIGDGSGYKQSGFVMTKAKPKDTFRFVRFIADGNKDTDTIKFWPSILGEGYWCIYR